jgi:APA family basic amino acid/polyamine antiporter
MTGLARALRTVDYFTLGFGTMVGVGWLVVMDDWLARGGPVGAILGFAIGGAALLPIGWVYGRLARVLPDAGSEIAYTTRAFRPGVGFAAGWMMTLAYLIVCPWEAVAIGKIAAYLVPALDAWPLYRVAGAPIYLPRLVLGLGLCGGVTWINYRGVRQSASFQNWTTFGLLALYVVVALAGLAGGSAANFAPPFSGSGVVSVFMVLQIVPYFMTGFESVPKAAEEAGPEFRAGGYFRAILAALLVAIVFYTSVIALVAWVAPWREILSERFATAAALGRAPGGRALVTLLFAAALLSLLKVFNGNFLAASRLLFALGRRGLVAEGIGAVHPVNRTPHVAVLLAGAATAAATLLGESILIPITEVGALASILGWLATCAASLRIDPAPRPRAVAALGLLVAVALVLIKVLPFSPGHFTGQEYAALGAWVAAGLLLRLWRRGGRGTPAREEGLQSAAGSP